MTDISTVQEFHAFGDTVQKTDFVRMLTSLRLEEGEQILVRHVW